MPERRFRDMRLTEAEARYVATEHVCTHDVEHDERFPGREDRFLDRAKRLLPLWRDIGLRELRYNGWIDGHNHATSRKESPF